MRWPSPFPPLPTAALVCASLCLACPGPHSTSSAGTTTGAATATSAPAPAQAPTSATSAAASASASASSKPAEKVVRAEVPSVSAKRALAVLFLGDAPSTANACLDKSDRAQAVECMLAVRYAKDKLALADALAMYRTAGWVAGLEHAREMDGGWRGMLTLVPELPIGRYRRHLKYLRHTAEEMARFFAAHAKHSSTPPKYRWQGLELKFFRSVGRTTPSAYARNWAIAYNVSGSLHRSANAVRETMFHEVFHLNDDGWSRRALTRLYEGILKRCRRGVKLSTPCLKPYAPHHTMVRGGTYYAFQPGNGVWEYAAELAVRYNREQRAQWLKAPPKAPFKCASKENAEAWAVMVEDLFAGVDATGDCP